MSILEDHTHDTPSTVVNTLCIIDTKDKTVSPLVSGADFYAQPRFASLGPYTSYILSYPQPDPPLHAAAHSISVSQSPTSDPGSHPLPSLQFDWTSPATGAVPDLTHTPLSPHHYHIPLISTRSRACATSKRRRATRR